MKLADLGLSLIFFARVKKDERGEERGRKRTISHVTLSHSPNYGVGVGRVITAGEQERRKKGLRSLCPPLSSHVPYILVDRLRF